MNFLSTLFFGVNRNEFCKHIQGAIDSMQLKDGIFSGDNLFTIGRNLGFLEDKLFMQAWRNSATTEIEKSIIWRIYTLAWAAKSVIARGIRGDFVECACYKGTTAKIVADYVDFKSLKERTYYLYDLFEHEVTMLHPSMPEHGASLYGQVTQRFIEFKNVKVIKGFIPEVLSSSSPDKIALLHLDLNNATAEVGALEVLFERISPGGILVLDDYGWIGYRAQKMAEDPWLLSRGYQVLELPTGQGLIFK